MRITFFLIVLFQSFISASQPNVLKTPEQYLIRILQRSIEVPGDTVSIAIFDVSKTNDTLIVVPIFSSVKDFAFFKRLSTTGLSDKIPDGFRRIVQVHCFRVFESGTITKQPGRAMLDGAAAVLRSIDQTLTVTEPINVIAYAPNH